MPLHSALTKGKVGGLLPSGASESWSWETGLVLVARSDPVQIEASGMDNPTTIPAEACPCPHACSRTLAENAVQLPRKVLENVGHEPVHDACVH